MGFGHVSNNHHTSTSQQVQRTKALDPTFIALSKENLKKKKRIIKAVVEVIFSIF